jgi:hypothetical protein
MKTLSYMLAIVAAGALGLSSPTLAAGHGHPGGYHKGAGSQDFERRVDRRQKRQWARIGDGIENGDLSRREVKRLRKDQRQIARMERRFERDGYYSPKERRIMERVLDRSSRRIERAKDDDHGRHHGRYPRGWRGAHHRHGADAYLFQEPEGTYVAAISSSTTLSAQTDGFSVSWNNSEQR